MCVCVFVHVHTWHTNNCTHNVSTIYSTQCSPTHKPKTYLGNGNGITLDMLDTQPCKLEVCQLLCSGLLFTHTGKLNALWYQGICLLIQPTT